MWYEHYIFISSTGQFFDTHKRISVKAAALNLKHAVDVMGEADPRSENFKQISATNYLLLVAKVEQFDFLCVEPDWTPGGHTIGRCRYFNNILPKEERDELHKKIARDHFDARNGKGAAELAGICPAATGITT